MQVCICKDDKVYAVGRKRLLKNLRERAALQNSPANTLTRN